MYRYYLIELYLITKHSMGKKNFLLEKLLLIFFVSSRIIPPCYFTLHRSLLTTKWVLFIFPPGQPHILNIGPNILSVQQNDSLSVV